MQKMTVLLHTVIAELKLFLYNNQASLYRLNSVMLLAMDKMHHISILAEQPNMHTSCHIMILCIKY